MQLPLRGCEKILSTFQMKVQLQESSMGVAVASAPNSSAETIVKAHAA